MQQLKRNYIRNAIILSAVLAVLLIVGSFLDLPISRLLYPGRESSLGQFFAAFGTLPAYLALSSAGVLLVVRRKGISMVWSSLVGLVGGFLIVFSVILSVSEAKHSVQALPVSVALLVTVFTAAVCAMGVLYLSQKASHKMVLRFVLTLVFVTLCTMLLANMLKLAWGRMRMSFILLTGNEAYFAPWWQAGNELKSKLIADGIPPDAFYSFPSMHVGSAACAMLAILLPTIHVQWLQKTNLCFWIGCGWTLIVAVSTICMGAHFLSDVVFGCAITAVLSALAVYLFYFHPKCFALIWQFLDSGGELLVARSDSEEI